LHKHFQSASKCDNTHFAACAAAHRLSCQHHAPCSLLALKAGVAGYVHVWLIQLILRVACRLWPALSAHIPPWWAHSTILPLLFASLRCAWRSIRCVYRSLRAWRHVRGHGSLVHIGDDAFRFPKTSALLTTLATALLVTLLPSVSLAHLLSPVHLV